MYKRYKNLIIEDPDDPPTHYEIRAIEQALEAKLPYDFLDFLDVANGGNWGDYHFTVPLKPRPEDMGFGQIFSTKRYSYRSFLDKLAIHTSPEYVFRIPKKVLPIAEDGGGSYLYLDFRVKDKSSVVAFIHGLPSWTGLHQKDTVIQIADSFTDYLNGLKFDVDSYKQHLENLIARNETKYISATIDYLELALPDWRDLFGIDYDDGRPRQLPLWD